jgi:hypothetical protein
VSRALALGLAVVALGCGHYGPPERAARAADAGAAPGAGAAAPTPAAPADPDPAIQPRRTCPSGTCPEPEVRP